MGTVQGDIHYCHLWDQEVEFVRDRVFRRDEDQLWHLCGNCSKCDTITGPTDDQLYVNPDQLSMF